MGYYERLGEMLRDRLNSDEDPFASVEDSSAEREEPAFVKEPFEPKKRERIVPVPPALVEDFLVLGLRPGESEEECKSAWKLLLKMHHPDKHQGSEDALRMAERATINITRAYRRIKHWFATGELPKE